jgi:uncharacterized protein YkuJ
MKIKFIGVPGEHYDSMHFGGVDFPLNRAVEVSDVRVSSKLRSHPHFQAEGEPVQDIAFKEKAIDAFAVHEVQAKQATAAEDALALARVEILDTEVEKADEPIASVAEQDASAIGDSAAVEKQEPDSKAKLVKRARSLGIEVDARWSEVKIRSAVINAEAAQARAK